MQINELIYHAIRNPRIYDYVYYEKMEWRSIKSKTKDLYQELGLMTKYMFGFICHLIASSVSFNDVMIVRITELIQGLRNACAEEINGLYQMFQKEGSKFQVKEDHVKFNSAFRSLYDILFVLCELTDAIDTGEFEDLKKNISQETWNYKEFNLFQKINAAIILKNDKNFMNTCKNAVGVYLEGINDIAKILPEDVMAKEIRFQSKLEYEELLEEDEYKKDILSLLHTPGEVGVYFESQERQYKHLVSVLQKYDENEKFSPLIQDGIYQRKKAQLFVFLADEYIKNKDVSFVLEKVKEFKAGLGPDGK